MRNILLFVLLAGSVSFARSAFSPGWHNPVAFGMGGASAAVTGTPLGVWSNPGLLSLSGRSAAAVFSPGRFGLTELSSGSVIYIEPTPVVATAILGTVFGFELYRETTLSLAFGRDLTQGFHASVIVHYYHLSISGYGAGSTIGISAGAFLRLLPDLTTGFALRNLNRPFLGDRLPTEFRIGAAYEPAGGFTIAVDLSKDPRFPFDCHVGVQYRLLPEIDLRAGGSTDPSTVSGGFAARIGSFALDYGVNAHPALGLSHLVAVSFSFR
ncbi:MAG: hypothetical protein OEV30_07960 [Ignavibacteria bacterium]|nr:hypothetical protein [Ignavibacteria bacterium]